MKKAFSLAEILITLMIIGVIAGMTIPALRKDSTNKATATSLKKIYSELNQIIDLVKVENYTNKICRTGLFDDPETFEKEFVLKKLQVAKVCSESDVEKCFGNSELVGSEKSYLLANGTAIAFMSAGTACNDGNDTNIDIYIDVNGPKPPNKGGTDQFKIGMNGLGRVYIGSGGGGVGGYESDSCTNAADDYQAAWACAIKIQQDGWEIKY